MTIVDTAVSLGGVYLITPEFVGNTLKEFDQDGRNVLSPTEEIPDLNQQQVIEAYSAIPKDYWSLSCWSCRDKAHTTFTCPYLTIPQRLFFAYRYFLYQVAANPSLKDWFKQKTEAMKGGANPGPWPGNGNAPPRSPSPRQRQAPRTILQRSRPPVNFIMDADAPPQEPSGNGLGQ